MKHRAIVLALAACGLHLLRAFDDRPAAAADPRPAVDVEIVSAGGTEARPVFSEERLRRIVRARLGKECDPTALEDALARRYRFLGYVPAITVLCAANGVRVRVRESSAVIDLITFDRPELSRIGVSADPGFEEKLRLYPVPADAPRAVLRGLLLTRAGDLYNFERYRSDREALAPLGYTVAFIAGGPAADSEYARGAYLIQSLTPRAPRAGGRKTNYIGGTASYGPRTKGAAGLLYEKQELFGSFDRLRVSPAFNYGAGGTLAYDAPLLADRASPRRLYDLGVSVYSDFTHDRQLGTVQTDERQTGFSGTLGIRPLNLRAPHTLRLETGFKSERIALERVPPGEEEGATDAAQIGATYEWRHTYRHPSLSVRITPRSDFALRASGGERTFVRPGVDGSLHARHPSGIETELHAVLGTMDRAVPSFEQWSLGGANTVRGFREDSFLGRHLAALQAEMWIPFTRPGPVAAPPEGWDPASAPFEPPAARLFKWALFLDGGTLSGMTVGGTTSIAGAGIGLRFLVPHHPFVVKIDYGRGLGGRGGSGFPYVSLTYRR